MKILLAMDSSPASQAALEEVAARPWPANSSIEAISVIESSHLWTTSEIVLEAERCAQEVVRRAVERLRSAKLAASGAALSGDPKTVILDRARTDAADLLVVGSHGDSAVARLLIGSVASAVLRYAPCSVEVVRAKEQPTPGRTTAGGMKILLATDGSEYSESAARAITERPWPAGSEALVLSVVELTLPPGRALFEVPAFDAEFLENARAEAMKRAQDASMRAREILSATSLRVTDLTSVLAEPPRSVILKEADEWGADLIVLGSHGRRGFEHFLMGSVSEYVATHSACTVEVVRKAG